MTRPKHLIEALALRIFFFIFGLLPLDTASWLGGVLGRAIGPRLRVHKTALNNMAMAFPEKSREELEQIARGMWDNLGRVAAELPHVPGEEIFRRTQTTGMEFLPTKDKPPAMLFSAHFGNWELFPPLSYRHGAPLTIAYRTANNKFVDKIIHDIRKKHSSGMLPKGAKGSIKIVRALKDGASFGMLVDQKMNDGIPVPFFGRDAMTAPATAQLAMRYNMEIVSVQVRRTRGAHFQCTILPFIKPPLTGDEGKDALAIMTLVNKTIEDWIRAYPEQWFWVHKRWPNA